MSKQRYPEEFKIEAVKQITERGQVKIGVDAPQDMNIVRGELLDRQEEFSFRKWFTKS